MHGEVQVAHSCDNPFDWLYSRLHSAGRPFGYSEDYFVWRSKQTKGELARYIDGPGKILDVGGGLGTLLRFLPVARHSLYLNLDYSFVMLTLGPKCHKMQASGLSMPLQDNGFEYVVCSEVLEHVPDKVALIAECYRVLRIGGRFLLTTPRTGWVDDYMASPFRIFAAIRDGKLRLHGLVPRELKSVIRKMQNRPLYVPRPRGVPDVPSDEAWLKSQLEKTGFVIEHQYRVDNHFPFGANQGESCFWRWFSDTFVDQKVFGHCTLLVARKEGGDEQSGRGADARQ